MSSLLPLRLKCYRQLLLIDTPDDPSIQDYQSHWREAQHTAKTLLHRLDTQRDTLTLDEKAELILTIWVLLQIGYRNPVLFQPVTEETYSLLPQLSTVNPQLSTVNCQLSTINCQLSIVNSQLSILLYHETHDENLLPHIDHLMAQQSAPDETEEYHYIQQLFLIPEYA